MFGTAHGHLRCHCCQHCHKTTAAEATSLLLRVTSGNDGLGGSRRDVWRCRRRRCCLRRSSSFICHELHHGTLDVCTVNKMRKYHSMCKTVDSVYVAIETQQRYFVKYQNILLSNPTDSLKYEEHQLEEIWRWVCWPQVYGNDSCKTHNIEKSEKPALP